MFKPVFIIDNRINFVCLSRNTNPTAIHLLEQNLDKVGWHLLSRNTNAIHILELYPSKIYWDNLSCNPNAIHLFIKLNTEQMRLNCRSFAEELSKYVFHPVRLSRLSQCYNIDLTDYFELM